MAVVSPLGSSKSDINPVRAVAKCVRRFYQSVNGTLGHFGCVSSEQFRECHFQSCRCEIEVKVVLFRGNEYVIPVIHSYPDMI